MRTVRRSGKEHSSLGPGPGALGGPRRRRSMVTTQMSPCTPTEAWAAVSHRAPCPPQGAWTCRRPAGPPGQSGTRLPSTAVSSSRMGRPAWWLSRQGCPSKRSWLGSASDTASMGLLWTSSWWAGTSLWCCIKTVASWSLGTCG
uniref:Uncharacterized protein n=1 Tax=Neovison vison TaxID=452646 RepID=A0A8C7AI06_NEOVI